MKLKFIFTLLAILLTAPVSAMEKELTEIKLDDFTPNQFKAIQQSGTFKIKGHQEIFHAHYELSGSTTALVKRLDDTEAHQATGDFQQLGYSGNEYWFKWFPLYKKSGSLKMFDTLTEGDLYEKKSRTDYRHLGYQKHLDEASPITRTPNPYGWAALGGTVLTLAAAATYGYFKLFKPSTQ